MSASDYEAKRRSEAMTNSDQRSIAIAAESELIGLLGKEIFFSTGLLGFPSCQRFNFNRFNPGQGSASPFFILESADQEVTFSLIHPDVVARDYPLEISPEVMSSIDVHSDADLVAMLIVTVRDRPEDITVNLQGPLIVNTASLIGMQLVVDEHPLRYPLLMPAVQ